MSQNQNQNQNDPYTLENIEAAKDQEYQLLDSFLNNHLINHSITVSNLIKDIVKNQLEELTIHRSLELDFRKETLTEEKIQLYLDSLVALRDRIKTAMERRAVEAKERSLKQ